MRQMGYYSTFVVRIWVDSDQKMSRGYVQHVATQKATHFVAFDKMEEFILRHLNPPQDDTCEQEGRINQDIPTQVTRITDE
ncbi:MAG: hypothetical protein E3J81_09305 [Dehalococcoidia bacterium]|nr:MAG: hypothetical protein E3J81_09305 [Dehalococcoidia bacterium]